MFIMLLAADSGGFGTLTMFLRTERFILLIGHGYILRAWFKNLRHRGLELYLGIQKWLQRYHNRGHQGIELKKPAEKYK